MHKETVRRSLPDSHETVSGIAGAVQSSAGIYNEHDISGTTGPNVGLN